MEKLAQEWWTLNRALNEGGDGTYSDMEAFMVGFRMCRDMMVTHLRKEMHQQSLADCGVTYLFGESEA